jgi:hypothetical protein
LNPSERYRTGLRFDDLRLRKITGAIDFPGMLFFKATTNIGKMLCIRRQINIEIAEDIGRAPPP